MKRMRNQLINNSFQHNQALNRLLALNQHINRISAISGVFQTISYSGAAPPASQPIKKSVYQTASFPTHPVKNSAASQDSQPTAASGKAEAYPKGP